MIKKIKVNNFNKFISIEVNNGIFVNFIKKLIKKNEKQFIIIDQVIYVKFRKLLSSS